MLSQLPLYRNARGVHVQVEANEKQSTWGGSSNIKPIPKDRALLARSLAAVALLPRLEAISIDLGPFAPAHSLPFFKAIGSQLKRAAIGVLPIEAYQYLTAIEELRVEWPDQSLTVTRCPGKELGACTRLRALSLSGKYWHPELGVAVRSLSADHSLRELNLTMNATSGGARWHRACVERRPCAAGAQPHHQQLAQRTIIQPSHHLTRLFAVVPANDRGKS